METRVLDSNCRVFQYFIMMLPAVLAVNFLFASSVPVLAEEGSFVSEDGHHLEKHIVGDSEDRTGENRNSGTGQIQNEPDQDENSDEETDGEQPSEPVLAEEEEEESYWSGAIDAGYTVTRGNTHMDDVFAKLEAIYDRGDFTNETTGDYRYAREDGIKTQDRASLGNQLNWELTPTFFTWDLNRVGYDRPANIELFFHKAIGAGYYFIKEGDGEDEKEKRLVGEAGPGLIVEHRTEGEDVQKAVFRVAERYRQEFSERFRIRQSVEVYFDLDDIGEYQGEADIESRWKLNSYLNWKVILTSRYNSNPAGDAERHDFEGITTIGYEF